MYQIAQQRVDQLGRNTKVIEKVKSTKNKNKNFKLKVLHIVSDAFNLTYD